MGSYEIACIFYETSCQLKINRRKSGKDEPRLEGTTGSGLIKKAKKIGRRELTGIFCFSLFPFSLLLGAFFYLYLLKKDISIELITQSGNCHHNKENNHQNIADFCSGPQKVLPADKGSPSFCHVHILL
ncbi:MAG: hypothetical protein GX766_01075 [Firmicutes bacterium]|nr:hypothetical protein [Bacillota bacterium]